MTTNLMLTCKRTVWHKKQWRRLINENDVHKWVIGFETGKDGYRHLQCRLRLSMGEEEAFLKVKEYLPDAYIQKCSDKWQYERKSGRFLSSDDTPEIRAVRFGKLLPWQERYIKLVETQSDRGIDVVYNPIGGIGKSWLVNHLWETGKAHYIPPYASTIEKIVQTTASLYMKQGWRDYLIIDIPRAYKWSEQLYVAIESIKDGLVMDMRYEAQTINIRGVKIIVMCNVRPDEKKLSADRWRIVEQ